MFLASKILSFATQPLAWVAILILATLLCVRIRPVWATRMGSAALMLLLLIGWEPLPDAVLRRLESQHPSLSSGDTCTRYLGVIVLGGALDPAYVWNIPAQSALNDAAERMTEVRPLLRQCPQLHVLFTGGEGELFAGDLSEAQRAKVFFDQQGLPADRVLYESTSRTTFENAIHSKSVKGVDPAQPWLLLTSAWHMPRAMAAFQRAGWNVTAYPVDFRSGKHTPWTQYSMDQGAKKWRMALHELLGLLAYRVAGHA